MLILFFSWVLLSWIAAGVGLAVLGNGPGARASQSREDAEDLLFLAMWLGLGLVAESAFVVVLLVPLDATVSGLILGAAVLIAGYGWYRVSASSSIRAAAKWLLAVLCIAAIILAERSTPVGDLDDAGGYHWSLIRWYREAGMPVGLGLFQWRLATHSSWLSLTALFDHGPMVSRTGNIANGLILVWMLTHLLIAGSRLLRGVAGKADVFIATAIVAVVPGMLGWEMRLSPSPDVPVILLCILVAWGWLKFRSVEPQAWCVLPLLALAAFAVTVKLSAVPLLAFMAVVALRTGSRESQWRWWLLAGAAVVPTGAVVAASFISTGCVLFPSPVLCLDVPWGVGADAARKYSGIVNAMAPRNITDWLVASGVALAAILVAAKSRLSESDRGLVAMAALGIGFTAWFAPTTRFGLGYLVLLPALAVAVLAPTVRAGLGRLVLGMRTALTVLLAAVVAIHFALPLYKEFVYTKLRARAFESMADRKRGDASVNALNRYWYLLPNRIGFEGPFVLTKANGFAYWISAGRNCWDHALPCATNPDLSFIPLLRLRDEGRGLRYGFTRRDRD